MPTPTWAKLASAISLRFGFLLRAAQKFLAGHQGQRGLQNGDVTIFRLKPTGQIGNALPRLFRILPACQRRPHGRGELPEFKHAALNDAMRSAHFDPQFRSRLAAAPGRESSSSAAAGESSSTSRMGSSGERRMLRRKSRAMPSVPARIAKVARSGGLGKSFRLASTITPSVPKEPVSSFPRS